MSNIFYDGVLTATGASIEEVPFLEDLLERSGLERYLNLQTEYPKDDYSYNEDDDLDPWDDEDPMSVILRIYMDGAVPSGNIFTSLHAPANRIPFLESLEEVFEEVSLGFNGTITAVEDEEDDAEERKYSFYEDGLDK